MTLDFPTKHPSPVTRQSGIAAWLGNFEAQKMLNESKIHNSKSIITRPSEPVLGNYEAHKK
jgi:hypothetical protein